MLRAVGAYALRWRLLRAAGGLLEALAAVALIVAGLLAFGGRGAVPLQAPWLWAIGAGAVVVLALVRLWWSLPVSQAALSIEHAFPFLQDRVATAVELARHGAGHASSRIAERIMREAAGALEALPLGRALPVRGLARPGLVLGLAVLLAAGAWVARLEAPGEPGGVRPAVAGGPDLPAAVAPGESIFDVVISVTPPAYTGLPARTLTPDAGTIRAPLGSSISVGASVQPPSLQARLLLTPGNPLGMAAGDSERRSAAFTLTERITCRIEADGQGRPARSNEWVMEPEADAPPGVRLTRPAQDLTLEVPGPVEVAVSASDDFLVAAVGLRCRLEGERQWRSLPLDATPGTAVSATATLNPTSLGLVEGKALLLCAWATDNDTVTGPKTSVSPAVTIRLRGRGAREEPRTPVEQAEQRQADAFANLQQAARELDRELSQALEQIARGAGSDEVAQMSTRLQEAAQRLMEQAGAAEEAMGRLEAQLSLDELVTPELTEKVRELHELMREAMGEELRRALEELQQALREADLERMQMTLEQAREAHREFMARLDQTLELLRRARMETELGRLRRLAEELLERQTELSERAESLPDESGPQAQRAEQDQRRLARDTEPLTNEVAAAAEHARQLSADLSRDLDALVGELMRRDAPGDMRQAAGALGRGRPSAAREPQQQAIETLRLAASRLAEAEEAVSQDMRTELGRAIDELLRDTLRLSEAQEAAEQSAERVQEAGAQDLLRNKRLVDPLRREQEALARSVDRLATRMDELARRTPVMDPTMGRDTAALAGQMRQAARDIEGAQLSPARLRQQEAVAALNETARRLLEMGEAVGGSSAAGMLSDYIKRLQQLAQRQQGLNDQTGQAADQGREPGQGSGSSLARLAFEQAMIRAALEQMIRGAQGGAEQVADQLGGLPGEMEKVEGDLSSGRLQRETLERQGRILQKMLDAQRSLYSKEPQRRERRAERPRMYEPPPPPPPLSPGLMQRRTLRLTTQPAQPRLPEGFEDMVQAYFERLGEGR